MSDIERRKFLRIDCLIETYILSITENEELDCSSGLTKNLSASGLLFRTNKNYQAGTVLSIEISPGVLNDLDENRGKIIKTRGFVLGKVVRIDELEDSVYDCAIVFISSQDEDDDYLRIFQDLINRAMFS
jgi:hypothetical protein